MAAVHALDPTICFDVFTAAPEFVMRDSITGAVTINQQATYAPGSGTPTGRDLWVFQKQGRGWIAVWRTMLDLEENAA